MVTFISLLQFTEKGSKQLNKTTVRAEAFKEVAAKNDIHIRHTYWLSGPYDLIHIFDAVDEDAAMVHSLSLSALGNVKTQTYRAYTKDEIENVMSKTFNAYDLLNAEG